MQTIISAILSCVFFVMSAIFGLTSWPSEQKLSVTPEMLLSLKSMREERKFIDLPGSIAEEERAQWEPRFNSLLDTLISEIPKNQSKLWLLSKLDSVVFGFYMEDTELRERCVEYVERVLVIAGVKSIDRAFYKYFIFI